MDMIILSARIILIAIIAEPVRTIQFHQTERSFQDTTTIAEAIFRDQLMAIIYSFMQRATISTIAFDN